MKLFSEFYDLKSKLLENEDQIMEQMQGNSFEEKTSSVIDWFIHGKVREKPMTTPSSKSKRKRGKMTPTILSVESTQEDLPSIGCRIRMCVGYDDKGKMSATIITPKEDVDHQFWYPKRNRVINEYKYIKDYYSWSDEVEKESDHAINTTSPKIYDLRTPQKKSERKKTLSSESSEKMYSSDSSDVMFDPNYDYKSTEFTKDSKPTNTISSSSRISSMPTKTDLSIVDKILLEESSYAKHSKTGSVNKAKQLQLKPVKVGYAYG